ncbi:MAG: hypothetical protein AAB420_01965 [Patescibacteria group bacterium]
MRWANFLHFYQPAGQQDDILEAIVDQSYRPLFEGFAARPRLRLTININGSLMELFDTTKYRGLIDILRTMGKEGRLEFTSTAKFHAVLPFINEQEILRQVTLNDETNRFYLGEAYQPRGFFAPEMAYKPELTSIIENMGFQWLILDEIAGTGGTGLIDYTKTHQIKGSSLRVFFRERRLSNLIMSAVVRSPETLKDAMKDDLASGRYMVTAMDGETFGHHRPGLHRLLLGIYDTPDFELIQVSEIEKYFPEIKEIQLIASTWASSKEDIERGAQFLSWSDPENVLHHLQWDFTKLVLDEVYRLAPSHPAYPIVRNKMDMALASDHFWWASAKPWWSLEMIEIGAFRLLDTIRQIPDVAVERLERASNYYMEIVITAFAWQRSGKIRSMMKEQQSMLRIPFKDRTIGRGGAEEGVYHAFIDMMKDLEQKAAQTGEYEKAILWRDALFKLENKLDIYDTINAIDLLRVEIPHKDVEATIEKYKAKYHAIRGGQPEQRGS